jgi:hypothetical protein
MLLVFGVASISARGRDKAPIPGKAEAKADRYAPFFKNVDESGARQPRSLTPVRPKSRTFQRRSAKMPSNILGKPEPYPNLDRPIQRRVVFSSFGLKR